MTVCNRCGKENQDHYKFCLGCGAELTVPKPGGGDMGMMKTMMADPGQAPNAGAPLHGPSAAMPQPPAMGRQTGGMGGPGPGMPGMPPAGPLGGPAMPPFVLMLSVNVTLSVTFAEGLFDDTVIVVFD